MDEIRDTIEELLLMLEVHEVSQSLKSQVGDQDHQKLDENVDSVSDSDSGLSIIMDSNEAPRTLAGLYGEKFNCLSSQDVDKCLKGTRFVKEADYWADSISICNVFFRKKFNITNPAHCKLCHYSFKAPTELAFHYTRKHIGQVVTSKRSMIVLDKMILEDEIDTSVECNDVSDTDSSSSQEQEKEEAPLSQLEDDDVRLSESSTSSDDQGQQRMAAIVDSRLRSMPSLDELCSGRAPLKVPEPVFNLPAKPSSSSLSKPVVMAKAAVHDSIRNGKTLIETSSKRHEGEDKVESEKAPMVRKALSAKPCPKSVKLGMKRPKSSTSVVEKRRMKKEESKKLREEIKKQRIEEEQLKRVKEMDDYVAQQCLRKKKTREPTSSSPPNTSKTTITIDTSEDTSNESSSKEARRDHEEPKDVTAPKIPVVFQELDPKCAICLKVFPTKERLEGHVALLHTKKATIPVITISDDDDEDVDLKYQRGTRMKNVIRFNTKSGGKNSWSAPTFGRRSTRSSGSANNWKNNTFGRTWNSTDRRSAFETLREKRDRCFDERDWRDKSRIPSNFNAVKPKPSRPLNQIAIPPRREKYPSVNGWYRCEVCKTSFISEIRIDNHFNDYPSHRPQTIPFGAVTASPPPSFVQQQQPMVVPAQMVITNQNGFVNIMTCSTIPSSNFNSYPIQQFGQAPVMAFEQQRQVQSLQQPPTGNSMHGYQVSESAAAPSMSSSAVAVVPNRRSSGTSAADNFYDFEPGMKVYQVDPSCIERSGDGHYCQGCNAYFAECQINDFLTHCIKMCPHYNVKGLKRPCFVCNTIFLNQDWYSQHLQNGCKPTARSVYPVPTAAGGGLAQSNPTVNGSGLNGDRMQEDFLDFSGIDLSFLDGDFVEKELDSILNN